MAKRQIALLVFILASCHSHASWSQTLTESRRRWVNKTANMPIHLHGALAGLNKRRNDENRSGSCFKAPLFCNQTRYRSIDGSCNNLERPAWGAPFTPYLRTLTNSYADGLSSFPRAYSGNELPSARKISTKLHHDNQIVDPVWNLNAMQWGQIVTHDMSMIDTNPFSSECCNNNQIPSTAADTPHCAFIAIPADDALHGPLRHQCLNFIRSKTTWDLECTSRNISAAPITLVTAYMDLSLVYGNSDQEAFGLRTGAGGRLASTTRGGNVFPPQHPNITTGCPFALAATEPCYLTGDTRANQNPELAILQIILMREHNRIADILTALNPKWDDEKLYQEARRINIATYQHINYYEYLPIILGWENMLKNKLNYPDVEGYVNDYSDTVNPSVAVEHASGAFRFFHTQIRGFLQLATESREVDGAIRLTDWLNRPLVLELNNGFNNLVRGFTDQEQGFSDQYFDPEVTEFLFRTNNNTFGTDLRATDIQRARDHGLGKYVNARAQCGLPVPDTFQDMTDFISPENVQILESLYKTPFDVELVVAAALENNVLGAQAGPTFLCILTEQFYRTRVGDRYFYENGADSEIALSLSQLQSIRQGASMARLFCDNVEDLQQMQPHAFQVVKDNNQLVPCASLPAIDLTLWQERKQ